jgi:SAM-dependent methyltransferase
VSSAEGAGAVARPATPRKAHLDSPPTLISSSGVKIVPSPAPASSTSLPSPLPTRLNLGCGQFPKEGFLNVDVLEHVAADVRLDLNDPSSYQLFPANHFELVVLDHVLEHLSDVFGVMAALQRILKPGGILEIRVPHCSRGITHPQHAHGFDVTFPEYFKPSFKSYMGTPLTLVSMRFDYIIRWDLKRPLLPEWQIQALKIVDKVVSKAANLQPYACSRFWCYLVGGFEQIEFIFSKPAD